MDVMLEDIDEAVLEGLPYAELRSLCKRFGLKASGKRAELAGRLLEAADGARGSVGPQLHPNIPTAAHLSAAVKLVGSGVFAEDRRFSAASEVAFMHDGDCVSTVAELREGENGTFAVEVYDRVLVGDPQPDGSIRLRNVPTSPENGYMTFDALMSSRYAPLIAERFGSVMPDTSFSAGNSASSDAVGCLSYDCMLLGAVDVTAAGGIRRMVSGGPLRVSIAMNPLDGTAAIAVESGGAALSIGGTTRQLESDMALLHAVKAAGMSLDPQTGRLMLG